MIASTSNLCLFEATAQATTGQTPTPETHTVPNTLAPSPPTLHPTIKTTSPGPTLFMMIMMMISTRLTPKRMLTSVWALPTSLTIGGTVRPQALDLPPWPISPLIQAEARLICDPISCPIKLPLRMGLDVHCHTTTLPTTRRRHNGDNVTMWRHCGHICHNFLRHERRFW